MWLGSASRCHTFCVPSSSDYHDGQSLFLYWDLSAQMSLSPPWITRQLLLESAHYVVAHGDTGEGK